MVIIITIIILLSDISTLRASEMVKQGIVFDPVRPCVRVRSITEKLLTRNRCNLVGMYVMMPLELIRFW